MFGGDFLNYLIEGGWGEVQLTVGHASSPQAGLGYMRKRAKRTVRNKSKRHAFLASASAPAWSPCPDFL